MRDPKPIVISVSNTDGDWLTVEVPWDADVKDLNTAFRTVLFWLGHACVDDLVPDPWREWAYLDEIEDGANSRYLSTSAEELQQSETHIAAEKQGKSE